MTYLEIYSRSYLVTYGHNKLCNKINVLFLHGKKSAESLEITTPVQATKDL